MNIELEFCDICNESIPAPDLAAGLAFRRGGRLTCATCERAMGSQEASLHGENPNPVSDSLGMAGAGGVLTETQSPAGSPPVQAQATTSSGGGGIWLGLVALVVAIGLSMSVSGRLDLVEGDTESALRAVRRDLHSARQDRDAAVKRLEDARVTQVAGLASQVQAQRELDQGALLQLTEQISLLRERLGSINGSLNGYAAQFSQLTAEQGAQAARGNAVLASLGERMRAQEDQMIAVEETLRAIALAPAPVQGGSPLGTALPPWNEALADLDSENPGLRLDAVYSLGASSDAAVIPYLVPMMEDNDVFVRMATCRTLSDLDARSAVPDLIGALGDATTVVREAAVVALRKITKRGMRFDPLGSAADRAQRITKWNEWWQREGEAFLAQS